LGLPDACVDLNFMPLTLWFITIDTPVSSLIFWIIASISYFYNSSLNYVICNISTKTFLSNRLLNKD
jgi:hypothetical protein